jgi:hypothetical protein
MKLRSLLGSASTDTTACSKRTPVTQGRLRILVDRHDDGLDVGQHQPSRVALCRTSAKAFTHGRFSAFSSYHLRGSVTMNDLPRLWCALHRPLLFLESVPLGAELVDPVEHPGALRLKQSKSPPVQASECPRVGGGLGAAFVRSLHGRVQAA